MEIKEINKIADLCRIHLSPEEKEELSQEMDSILGFVEQIQSVEAGNKEDTVGLVKNILRKDKSPHESGLYTETLIKVAPESEGGYLKVKKIL